MGIRQTRSELIAELADLRARRAAMAGIRSTAFADQSTTFDQDGLDKRIAAIERQLCGSGSYYVSTSKGV